MSSLPSHPGYRLAVPCLLALLTFTGSLTLSGQRAAPGPPTMAAASPDRIARIDRFLQSYIDGNQVAGLVALVGRQFDAARAQFETVLQLWPNDTPARDYLAELDGFRDTPPPEDWDGVVTMKTK